MKVVFRIPVWVSRSGRFFDNEAVLFRGQWGISLMEDELEYLHS